MKTVAVSASFTGEVIEPFLVHLLAKSGCAAEVKFAPYNQVFQELLDPGSLLRTNSDGVNVVLVRWEDWLHYQTGDHSLGRAGELLEKNLTELADGLAAFPPDRAPLVVVVAAPSPAVRNDPDEAAAHARLEDLFRARLADRKNVSLITSGEIDALYPVADYYDAQTDRAGHIPFTEEYFAALAAMVARRIFALTARPIKVIAADCDETLWRGVAGEVGARVTVDAPARFLQEFLVQKKNEGLVLCLCSKNEMATVEEVFHGNADMVLTLDDLATHRVNWDPKPANIRSLAAELNLGTDSFVFLDDSPAECRAMEELLPEVFTICLPADPARLPQFLRHLWIFDRPRVTAEDRERNAFYRENALRQQEQAKAGSLADYIASLALRVEIGEPEETMIPRLAQLSQRTNQFNTTATRYTEAELTGLLADPSACCRFTAAGDRFGDYGIVGLVTGTFAADTLTVRAFLMSCRAMSRGVEHGMVQDAGRLAVERGAGFVEILFVPSPRNKPMADFLATLTAEVRTGADGVTAFRLPAATAAELVFRPDESAPAEAAEPAKPKPTAPAARPNALQPALLEIAREYDTAARIVRQVKRAASRPQRADREIVPPANEVEACLCGLFAGLLNVEPISATESFFDLGGFSLAATLLSSRINRLFGVECTLETIAEKRTPRALAEDLTARGGRLDPAVPVAPEHRFVEERCTVDGHTLHYARIGAGPKVVLLHGLFGCKEHCFELAAGLASSYEVIIPDLPGFGGSTDFPPSSYRFDAVLGVLQEFFHRLHLEKLHLAGNSMGASLAGIYAARHPGQVLSVAFLGPPAITCPILSEVERLAAEGITISVPRTMEEFRQKIDFLFAVKPRVLAERLDEIGRAEIAAYDAHIGVYRIIQKDEGLLDTCLDRIPCPTLILWGENDRFKDVSGAHRAAQIIPQSRLHILPNAGHALFQEYPEEIATIYRQFLAEIDTPAAPPKPA